MTGKRFSYRGKHCPLCTKYLQDLETILPDFHVLGVDVVAVSADTEKRAKFQIDLVQPSFPVGCGLSIEQMHGLGLYISNPQSAEEADRPFAEPRVFVVNENGQVQITDISNAHFARPDLKSLLDGLLFIRESNYPIRGTHIASARCASLLHLQNMRFATRAMADKNTFGHRLHRVAARCQSLKLPNMF